MIAGNPSEVSPRSRPTPPGDGPKTYIPMLDFQEISRQMSDFGAYQKRLQHDRTEKRQRALALFHALETSYDAEALRAVAASSERLVAEPVEPPWRISDAPDRPTPVTVVATDGSQIYPDRNIEPTCFLLNIGEMVFQYGTLEPPHMVSMPRLYYRGQDLEGLEGPAVAIIGPETVSALRDELEMESLLLLARAYRKAERPILALADGTLIRWMLRGLRNRELEQRLLRRYTSLLAAFREEAIPLCSYISMPANNEFINLLDLHRAFLKEDGGAGNLDGISDRVLFQAILEPGQRSAVFKSQSLVLKEYPAGQEMCYFYVRVDGERGATEIARVEFPIWLLEEPANLDLVHATILNECRKGNGYPVVLSAAHEHAAVREPERRLFYEMIERELSREGQAPALSLKQMSKERPSL